MGDFLNRIAIPIKATQHPLLLLLLLLLQSLEYLLHLDLQKATFLSQLNSLAISSSDTHSHRLFHPSHTHTLSLPLAHEDTMSLSLSCFYLSHWSML